MISVVIPYMHSKERKRLLYRCLKSLPKDDVEICIHEIGKKRHLRKSKYRKHLFTKFKGVFHRAWAINVGVRELSTGNKLVLMDGDLMVSNEWFEEVKKCNHPAVGWGSMYNISEAATENILEDELDPSDIEPQHYYCYDKIKTPRIDGPAGGITIINREVFYKVKGIPENFGGTWGGEDNAMFSKLHEFGYPFSFIQSRAFHLYHTKSTPRNLDIMNKIWYMMRWSRELWQDELDRIGDDWGNPDVIRKDDFDINPNWIREREKWLKGEPKWVRNKKVN